MHNTIRIALVVAKTDPTLRGLKGAEYLEYQSPVHLVAKTDPTLRGLKVSFEMLGGLAIAAVAKTDPTLRGLKVGGIVNRDVNATLSQRLIPH